MLHLPIQLGDVTLCRWDGRVDLAHTARRSLPEGWVLSVESTDIHSNAGRSVVDLFSRVRRKRLLVLGPFDIRRVLGAYARYTPLRLGRALAQLHPGPSEAVVVAVIADTDGQIASIGWDGAIVDLTAPRVKKKTTRKSRGRLGQSGVPKTAHTLDIQTAQICAQYDPPVSHREARRLILQELFRRGSALPRLVSAPLEPYLPNSKTEKGNEQGI